MLCFCALSQKIFHLEDPYGMITYLSVFQVLETRYFLIHTCVQGHHSVQPRTFLISTHSELRELTLSQAVITGKVCLIVVSKNASTASFHCLMSSALLAKMLILQYVLCGKNFKISSKR